MAKHEPERPLDDDTLTDIIAAVIFLIDKPGGLGAGGLASAIDQARQAFDKAEAFLAVRRERAAR